MSSRPERHSGQKFRAFRAWTLDGYRLRSANPAGGHWVAGVNRAECRRATYVPPSPLQTFLAAPERDASAQHAGAHRAPDHRCRCGLYAWHETGRLAGFPHGDAELVYGAVLAWGRVEVHLDGLRSEYAEPVLLGFSESQSYRHVRRVQAIGSELGLPVVELAELEDAARAFGQPVPADLRPHRAAPFEVDPRWAVPLASGVLVAAAGLVGGIRQAQRRAGTSAGQAGTTRAGGDGS